MLPLVKVLTYKNIVKLANTVNVVNIKYFKYLYDILVGVAYVK